MDNHGGIVVEYPDTAELHAYAADRYWRR